MSKEKALMPPYVSPGTFANFVHSLRNAGLPSRVDKSVPFISTKSNLVQGQLLAALKYLGLTTKEGNPTQALKDYVNAEGEAQQKVQREIFRKAYPYLFDDFDLGNATTNLIAEQFKTHAKVSAASMVFRCVAFAVSFAREAGLSVSPHIKPNSLRPKKTNKKEAKGQSDKAEPVKPDPKERKPKDEPPPASEKPRKAASWEEMLLAKFPDFDPAWDEELRKQWFAGFEKLMKARE